MGFRGDILRALREKQGYSMEELGKKFGLTKYQVHRYETGASDPSSTLVSEFADFFEVTTDYLLGRDKIASEKTFDSLDEITKYVKELGFTDMGFFDINEWKNLSPEDVEMVKRHFDMIAEIAKKRKKDTKK